MHNIAQDERKLYSANFLLAELHEHEEGRGKDDQHKDIVVKDPVSSQYNSTSFETYNFYKPVSTVLHPASIQLLQEVDL